MTEKEQNGGEHCNESAVDETETKANGHLTSDDLIDEEDDSFNACNFACIETLSDTVTSFVQGVFHKIGLFSGRFPWLSILIGLLIFALPMIGMKRYYEETNASKLWVPSNSRAVLDSKIAEEWFPVKMRVVRLIVEGEDMLTPEGIEAVLGVDERVKAVTTKSPRGRTLEFDRVCYEMGSECLQMSILSLWSYSRYKVERLTKEDIIKAIQDSKDSDDEGWSIDVEETMGGVTKNADRVIEKATALSLTYFLKTNNELLDPEPKIAEWEQNYLDECSKGIESEGYTLYYMAVRSFKDIGAGAIKDDLRFLGMGYVLVVLYLFLTLGNLNCRDHKIFVALAGVMCIVMSVGISYGLSSAVGIAAGPLNRLLPFLLLGIGVDNMFVFVAALENLHGKEKEGEVRDKIGLMVKHAGVSILITSLTDVSAFGIGATTIIPSLRSFCLFSAYGVVGVFFITLFFFTGVLTYDQMRKQANRFACLFCCKLDSEYEPNACSLKPLSYRVFDEFISRALSKMPVKVNFGFIEFACLFCCKLDSEYEPNACSLKPLSYRVFDEFISRALSKMPVKVVVIVLAVVLFAIGLIGAVRIEQDYQQDWFIPEGNYFYDFIQTSKQYFPNDGEQAFVYFGEIDYFDNLDAIRNLPKELGKLPQIEEGRIDFWLTSFFECLNETTDTRLTKYLDENNQFKTNEDFLGAVYTFVNQRQGLKYKKEVNFNKEGTNITSSRMMFWYSKTSKSIEGIEAMDNSRAIVDNLNLGEDNAFIYSEILLTWEGFKVIRWELFRNVGLAFAVVFLVCMVLIANIVTVMLVLCCVVFTMVEVVGFLYFWGLTINVVTTIVIVLSIGLVVDYAAHIGHSFMVSTGSKQQRMRKCLRAMGVAVFNGGFSTFLAFLPLVMSTSFVFSTFFKVFLLVAACGLFHGLIFLPVTLSWFGPSPYLSVTQGHSRKGSKKDQATPEKENAVQEMKDMKADSEV